MAFSGEGLYPDHRKDLKNRSPNLGPYTTKGTLKEPLLRIYFFWILPVVWLNESRHRWVGRRGQHVQLVRRWSVYTPKPKPLNP